MCTMEPLAAIPVAHTSPADADSSVAGAHWACAPRAAVNVTSKTNRTPATGFEARARMAVPPVRIVTAASVEQAYASGFLGLLPLSNVTGSGPRATHGDGAIHCSAT